MFIVYCFITGKKGRVLEAEVKELVEERNLLAERKKRPLYRKVSPILLYKLYFVISDLIFVLFFFLWDICLEQELMGLSKSSSRYIKSSKVQQDLVYFFGSYILQS